MEDVVREVVCPYRGAAHALQTRTKQLEDLIYATKQYIHQLRRAASISASVHKECALLLNIADKVGDLEHAAINDLLASDGLRMILQQLAEVEERIASTKESKESQPVFAEQIQLLDQELVPVQSLLHKSHLGRAHQRRESKLCNKAVKVTRAIEELRKACDAVTMQPERDPYILHLQAQDSLDQYLKKEVAYAKLCFAEQAVVKALEPKIFSILEEIPVDFGRTSVQNAEKSQRLLQEVLKNVKTFHALTDWAAFENENADKFISESTPRLDLSTENRRKEAQWLQFQDIYEPALEIYHNLHKRRNRSRHGKSEKVSLLKRFKESAKGVVTSKHEYGVRGEWYISRGGYLIEFDEKERSVLSRFDICKAKVGRLASDTDLNYGYFSFLGRKIVLEGQRMKNRNQNYKFRLPLDKAIEFHTALRFYCTGHGVLREAMDADEASVISEPANTSEEATLVSRQASNA
jgi:hypothetical protein